MIQHFVEILYFLLGSDSNLSISPAYLSGYTFSWAPLFLPTPKKLVASRLIIGSLSVFFFFLIISSIFKSPRPFLCRGEHTLPNIYD